MYNSIKAWINVAIQIKPFVQYDGAGDPEYDDPIDALCYPEGKAIMVRNASGKQIVSQKQLYMFGDTTIGLTDAVVFDGVDYVVQAISPYYRNGQRDILVVYI